ncbi:MFS transporter [Macrococcus carouselicus]|uniref:MFS transporter n=1 Tax=Macrococcus carouselicus TaxID=69969 RepID=A0A9Q8CMA6_9STAP|nr:MFS transporter [Macrococcus carouselicus]TDM02411.1 MFS transporter [Macrococcus carouselicus]
MPAFNRYRRFLLAVMTARTIDWIDIIVLNWLVFHSFDDVMYLSYINAARLLPALIFAALIGRIVDRSDMTRLMYGIQSAVIVVTMLIMWFNVRSIVLLTFLVAVKSVFVSLDQVQRNTLLPSFVDSSRLSEAISINALILNLARLVGPFLAGVLMTIADSRLLLILPAAGAIAVILLNQSLPDKECRPARQRCLTAYLKQEPQLCALIASSASVMFFGLSISIILPVIAETSHRYALYTALLAAGSIAVLLIMMKAAWSTVSKMQWMLAVTVIACLGLLHQSVWLTLLSLFIIGAATQGFRTINRVLIQERTAGAYRGSVIAVAMMDRGFIPLGGILLTFIIKHYGLPAAIWTMVTGLGLTFMISRYYGRNQYDGMESNSER